MPFIFSANSHANYIRALFDRIRCEEYSFNDYLDMTRVAIKIHVLSVWLE